MQEYWIIDWRLQQVEIYQREKATLILVKTLFTNDELTSPLFPNFVCIVGSLFV